MASSNPYYGWVTNHKNWKIATPKD
jgi:hypothetical protein